MIEQFPQGADKHEYDKEYVPVFISVTYSARAYVKVEADSSVDINGDRYFIPKEDVTEAVRRQIHLPGEIYDEMTKHNSDRIEWNEDEFTVMED